MNDNNYDSNINRCRICNRNGFMGGVREEYGILSFKHVKFEEPERRTLIITKKLPKFKTDLAFLCFPLKNFPRENCLYCTHLTHSFEILYYHGVRNYNF